MVFKLIIGQLIIDSLLLSFASGSITRMIEGDSFTSVSCSDSCITVRKNTVKPRCLKWTNGWNSCCLTCQCPYGVTHSSQVSGCAENSKIQKDCIYRFAGGQYKDAPVTLTEMSRGILSDYELAYNGQYEAKDLVNCTLLPKTSQYDQEGTWKSLLPYSNQLSIIRETIVGIDRYFLKWAEDSHKILKGQLLKLGVRCIYKGKETTSCLITKINGVKQGPIGDRVSSTPSSSSTAAVKTSTSTSITTKDRILPTVKTTDKLKVHSTVETGNKKSRDILIPVISASLGSGLVIVLIVLIFWCRARRSTRKQVEDSRNFVRSDKDRALSDTSFYMSEKNSPQNNGDDYEEPVYERISSRKPSQADTFCYSDTPQVSKGFVATVQAIKEMDESKELGRPINELHPPKPVVTDQGKKPKSSPLPQKRQKGQENRHNWDYERDCVAYNAFNEMQKLVNGSLLSLDGQSSVGEYIDADFTSMHELRMDNLSLHNFPKPAPRIVERRQRSHTETDVSSTEPYLMQALGKESEVILRALEAAKANSESSSKEADVNNSQAKEMRRRSQTLNLGDLSNLQSLLEKIVRHTHHGKLGAEGSRSDPIVGGVHIYDDGDLAQAGASSLPSKSAEFRNRPPLKISKLCVNNDTSHEQDSGNHDMSSNSSDEDWDDFSDADSDDLNDYQELSKQRRPSEHLYGSPQLSRKISRQAAETNRRDMLYDMPEISEAETTSTTSSTNNIEVAGLPRSPVLSRWNPSRNEVKRHENEAPHATNVRNDNDEEYDYPNEGEQTTVPSKPIMQRILELRKQGLDNKNKSFAPKVRSSSMTDADDDYYLTPKDYDRRRRASTLPNDPSIA